MTSALRVLPLLLVVLPFAATAQVYRWTDAAGQVHYTQTPPPGQPVATVKQAPPPAASPGVEQMKAFNAQAARAAEEKAQADAKRRQDREKAEAACTRARSAISTLESRPPSRIARKDEQGQFVRMTPAEHEASLAKARATAEKNCE